MSMYKKYDRETTPTEHDTTPTVKKEEPKLVNMIPLFSWRTIIAVAIGFIVGVGLAFVYWIISPSLSSSDETTDVEQGIGGLAGFIGTPQEGHYESRVNIQLVNPGSSYTSLRELQQKGEYYTAKANSLPSLKFIAERIAEEVPEYSHTADELNQMLSIQYNWNSEVPSIELVITGNSDQEALFLAEFVPEAFKEYLIVEAEEAQKQEYENILNEINTVKATILEEEEELSTLLPEGTAGNISNDPIHIALNAKIEALEAELEQQAQELSILIASGDISEYSNILEKEYQQTLEEMRAVNASLSEAKHKLEILETEKASEYTTSSYSDIITLNAKIKALELEIDRLMTGDDSTTGLADMIARDITTSSAYKDTIDKIDKASKALAEAKKELAILESQSGNIGLEEDLDYQVARAEVNTLNMEMTVLQERLSELTRELVTGNSQPDTQAAFERTSTALSEAKKELAILESQSGSAGIVENLEYQILQSKIVNLNSRLSGLTEELSYLLEDDNETTEATDFIVVGNPSLPVPILPERVRARNALMVGAIVGIGGAWAIVNWRWLRQRLTSSPRTSSMTPDEEDEEA
jgi:hypothetical protein